MRDTRSNHRFLELDVLRGMASLAVLLFHFIGVYNDDIGHSFRTPSFARFGYYGVHLFFMISGFVILMSAERARRPIEFLVARFARLFPIYWISVVISFGVVKWYGLESLEVGWRAAVINLTMLQRFVEIPHVNASYWTLPLELSFYFWVFVMIARRAVSRMESLAIAWLGLEIALQLARVNGLDLTGGRLGTLLLAGQAHLFVAGIMFYRLQARGHSWLRHATILSSIPIQFLVSGFESAAIVASFVALFYLCIARRMQFMVVRPLVFLGSISYALYVIHNNLGFVLMHALEARGVPAWLSIAMATAASLFAASVLHVAIEKPAMSAIRGFRLEDAYLDARSRQPA